MDIRRGDIWMIDFGVPRDDEDHLQHNVRPGVIVSNNSANEHSMVLHVVPFTSKVSKKRSLPTHVFINSFLIKGLDHNSTALCEQLCCINEKDLIRHLGTVTEYQLTKINYGIKVQLGIITKNDR